MGSGLRVPLAGQGVLRVTQQGGAVVDVAGDAITRCQRPPAVAQVNLDARQVLPQM
jgi:hypothetical protein